ISAEPACLSAAPQTPPTEGLTAFSTMRTRSGRVVHAPLPFDLAGELRRQEERRIAMEAAGLDPFAMQMRNEEDVPDKNVSKELSSVCPTENYSMDSTTSSPPLPNPSGPVNAYLGSLTSVATAPAKPKHPKAAKRAARRGPSREIRKRKREEDTIATGSPFKKVALKKGIAAAEDAKRVTFEADKIRVATTGWHGVAKGRISRRMYDLDEARAEGLEVIEWDGKEVIPVVAAEDERCLLVLGGGPLDDASFQAQTRSAERAMDHTREQISFTPKEKSNP
ncbi:hypothetical protein V5O48_018894, partial [Marasmius crinis-equi]